VSTAVKGDSVDAGLGGDVFEGDCLEAVLVERAFDRGQKVG
jgi:hypothetical protein